MFTEYMRDCVGTNGQINGIKYFSSRNENGICYVIFTDDMEKPYKLIDSTNEEFTVK